MPRLPAPWPWKARKAWYATVAGTRHKLATFEEGKKVAQKRLANLVGSVDRPTSGTIPTVGEIFARYTLGLTRRRDGGEMSIKGVANTRARYLGFVRMHHALRFDEVKSHHVETWLDTQLRWGRTARHDGVSAVKGGFRWAVRQGYISHSPIESMKAPRRNPRREDIPTVELINAVIAAETSPGLRDLLWFIQDTGCRPGEARILEAKQIDREKGIAVLSQHKTAEKTRRKRVIYLTGRAAEIAYRLAELRPEGTIFRNSRNKDWAGPALVKAVKRLRERVKAEAKLRGEPVPDLKTMVAYALRHSFATDALAKQIPVVLVAELMGHKDTSMMGVYSHISDRHDVLREAAEKATNQKAS